MIIITSSRFIYLNINIPNFKYLQLPSSLCFKHWVKPRDSMLQLLLFWPPPKWRQPTFSLDTDLKWKSLKSVAHPWVDNAQKCDLKHVLWAFVVKTPLVLEQNFTAFPCLPFFVQAFPLIFNQSPMVQTCFRFALQKLLTIRYPYQEYPLYHNHNILSTWKVGKRLVGPNDLLHVLFFKSFGCPWLIPSIQWTCHRFLFLVYRTATSKRKIPSAIRN